MPIGRHVVCPRSSMLHTATHHTVALGLHSLPPTNNAQPSHVTGHTPLRRPVPLPPASHPYTRPSVIPHESHAPFPFLCMLMMRPAPPPTAAHPWAKTQLGCSSWCSPSLCHHACRQHLRICTLRTFSVVSFRCCRCGPRLRRLPHTPTHKPFSVTMPRHLASPCLLFRYACNCIRPICLHPAPHPHTQTLFRYYDAASASAACRTRASTRANRRGWGSSTWG